MVMKKYILIPALALCMVFCACSTVNNPLENLVIDDPTPTEPVDPVSSRGYAIPIKLDTKQQQINEQLAAFSWKLFNESYKLREKGKNVLISPVSLEVALGMFVNGLSAEEQQQVLKTLGLENFSVEDVNAYFQTMMEGLADADDVAELHMANSFWYTEGRNVKSDFASVLNNSYKAESNAVNFSKQSTIDAINAWCAKQTKDRIRSILDNGVDPSIYAVLLNAVYFKSSWKDEFDEKRTHKQPFHYADGTDAEVDMMNKRDTKFDYLESEDYQAVTLPFVNEAYKLFVILPKEGKKVGDIAGIVKPQMFNDFQTRTLDYFAMPKFEVSYTEEKLAQAMQQINPELGFGGLNFQPLLPEITSETAIEVLQKTFFKVDEKGAEAAAVTGIIAKNTSVSPSNNMILDRPFIYGIMETSTNCPLFIGYYGEK
jgi:serpin B